MPDPEQGYNGNAGPLQLHTKTQGKAKFIFCAEDSWLLRRTLHPDQQPMPYGKVFVTGDWNNFNTVIEDIDPEHGAKEMFDDGSIQYPKGDDQIGDGVYTRVLDLPPGEHTYCFIANGVSINELTFEPDPYAERTRTVTIRRDWKLHPDAPPRTMERTFRASVIAVP